MNLKTKIRSYGFWIAVIAIIVSIITILNKYYNLGINVEMIIAFGGVICSALISFGIIKNDEQKLISEIKEDIKKSTETFNDEKVKDNNLNDIKIENEDKTE